MKQSKMPKRRWTAGRGALVIIAMLFMVSAAIRIGIGAGPALAKEVAAIRSGSNTATTPQACQNPAEIQQVLSVLSKRRTSLDERERSLQNRAQDLAVAAEQVSLNMTALVAAEGKLAATMARSETAAEDDLVRLTSVYENMKSKEAAVLFETMSPEFAAGFVGRMRPDAAAQIMAGLSPGVAYSISVILAGRNADAPTE